MKAVEGGAHEGLKCGSESGRTAAVPQGLQLFSLSSIGWNCHFSQRGGEEFAMWEEKIAGGLHSLFENHIQRFVWVRLGGGPDFRLERGAAAASQEPGRLCLVFRWVPEEFMCVIL